MTKDISWIVEAAKHHKEKIEQIWEDREGRIIHPGHIYWMMHALEELAGEIQILKNEISKKADVHEK